jgi:putative endonuclease
MRLPRLDRLLRLALGSRGERLAARHLQHKGLRILARRFRVRRGEIDLVARDRDVLVFVEVKTRRRGDPAEAVTPEKQRRLTRAALAFLRRYDLLDAAIPCRFDVVVVWSDDKRPAVIEHLIDAFQAADV